MIIGLSLLDIEFMAWPAGWPRQARAIARNLPRRRASITRARRQHIAPDRGQTTSLLDAPTLPRLPLVHTSPQAAALSLNGVLTIEAAIHARDVSACAAAAFRSELTPKG